VRVYVFPGQGSQKQGMGEALFDQVNEFRAMERELNTVLGFSVRELCTKNPENRLSDTRYTQPALFVVNALSYYKAVAEEGKPDLVAGHSLGEYNALLAAGAFDFMTGLRLVKRRGELMAQATGGAMAAVVGLRSERVEQVLRDSGLSALDIANYNSPEQVVLSGPQAEIVKALPIFDHAGAQLCVPLPVSGAFHSRYMAASAALFDQFLSSITFRRHSIPAIANVTGRPYADGDPTTVTRGLLVRQMTQPVQWVQSVRYMLHQTSAPLRELGPGNVLTRLTQQIRAVQGVTA
jgi:malonyl CoA-acyl carrier protein transacylase